MNTYPYIILSWSNSYVWDTNILFKISIMDDVLYYEELTRDRNISNQNLSKILNSLSTETKNLIIKLISTHSKKLALLNINSNEDLIHHIANTIINPKYIKTYQ